MNSIPDRWASPPAELHIGEGEAHLWRVRLDMAFPEGVGGVLSPDELARAQRFRFEGDSRRYTISNYALRDVLSRYLGVPPRGVPISTSARGKPYVEGAGSGSGINFSLSHARGVAMVAVANRRVGVDVEEMVEDFPHMEIAEGFFAKGEVEALRAEVDALRRGALFFSYWTRKEALLKASGEGLYEDLGAIDFSKHGSAAGSRMRFKGTEWTVVELEPNMRLFSSLALEGDLKKIESYAWEPRRIV